MFETLYDLVKDPSNVCNWIAFFELLLALAAVVAGLAAVIYAPAFWPLGLLLALGGGAGLAVGHL